MSRSGGASCDKLAPMIRPYRFAVTLADMVDLFAEVVPEADLYMVNAAREFSKLLRKYAGPEDPIDPPK